MASDGDNLFVIFLYMDIQWTQTQTANSIALVGFDAGDQFSYYSLPGSRTDAIANVTRTSNVGMPGVWVFKVSGPSVESGGCLDMAVGEYDSYLRTQEHLLATS